MNENIVWGALFGVVAFDLILAVMIFFDLARANY